MPRFPEDVIAFPVACKPGVSPRWVIMNVFTRTSLAVDSSGFQAIASICEGGILEGKFRYWEVERFTNSRGLLADPTRFEREPERWGAGKEVSAQELAGVLLSHFLLIETQDEYFRVFGRKKNLFDKEKLGNYHDQLGAHLILDGKVNPSTWWISQKFDDGLRRVKRDSLYFAVQEQFLEKYFPSRLAKGGRFLDVGCGVGYFANLAARSGAGEVVGVDPSADYVAAANSVAERNASFQRAAVGSKDGLAALDSQSFDFIFMSDALQFYFVPYGKDQASIEHLLADLGRVLKPNGTFTFMEPHPSFYQAPWLGGENRPFTVKTEYRNRVQGIIPTLQEYVQPFLHQGYSMIWLEEVYPGPIQGECESRALSFAREFPLWVVYEFRKGSK